MNILEQIDHDFQQAYKEKNESVVSVLRMIKAALQNAQIQKKDKLGEDDVLKVLHSESKKRKEAVTEYDKAGRQELADKEKAELEIISKYMPAQMSEDQIKEKVKEIIKQQDTDNIGKVMGAVMQELKGQADGNLVKQIVEQELSQ
ncbi:GatB/YqeY domain-containing protein [Patescibacteria group bacterium]